MGDHYDVIIVGSGAGGGTLAHRLAPSGKRVLILERGDWLPARARELGRDGGLRRQPLRLRRTRGTTSTGKAFQPQVHYFVGGATKFYGAALYRLRERDFGELKHHGGISPAWPIDYDVLEPYYTQAEELYQVHGARGEDPTEPPASAPYPFPPVSHEPRIQRLFDDLAQVGLHPFHSPCGIMLDEAEPALQPVHPVRDLRRVPVPGARQVRRRRDRRTSRAAARQRHAGAQRRRTPAGDRRAGPHGHLGRRRRRRRRSSASPVTIVVVSAGAANSAKLLLASANDQHPHGLANGSDQVGRNYVFHNSRAFLAVSTEKNDTRFQKTLGLNDYYFGDADFDFPMGNLQMVGKSSAPMYRGEKPLETELAPTLRAARRRRARRSTSGCRSRTCPTPTTG